MDGLIPQRAVDQWAQMQRVRLTVLDSERALVHESLYQHQPALDSQTICEVWLAWTDEQICDRILRPMVGEIRQAIHAAAARSQGERIG